MHFRLTILFLLSFAPIFANASDGILYDSVYQCNSIEINKKMASICSSKVPELSARASNAYEAWFLRNNLKAKSAEKSCTNQLNNLAKKEGQHSELYKINQQIEQLKTEMIDDFQNQVITQGAPVCENALRQLEKGTGGIDLK